MRRPPATSDRALLLRVSPYGDADAVVQLLTERSGVVSAIAKRARASTKRAWVLEPFHTLAVELAATSGELASLRGASIAVARAQLLEDAARLDAAGLITRWTRALSPVRVPEPEVFAALERALDALAGGDEAEAVVTAFGWQLLDVLGYALELSACARCGRARPAGRAGYVSGSGGGVLCESCRRGAAIDAPLIRGAVLDHIAADPWSVHDAPAEERALLARIVREAIVTRARSVGAQLSS